MNQDCAIFEPAQHFLTLLKHTKLTYSEKILMVTMLNRFIEENVANLAGILDKLEQWYIHYHISIGTLFYFLKLSKTEL